MNAYMYAYRIKTHPVIDGLVVKLSANNFLHGVIAERLEHLVCNGTHMPSYQKPNGAWLLFRMHMQNER